MDNFPTLESLLAVETMYTVIKIIVILIAARVLISFLKKGATTLFKVNPNGALHMNEQRSDTLTKLLQSVITYVIWFLAVLMILIELGFDPLPVLAGAGVLGLAIGFGAQNIVRDVITGFFIIYEDQFGTGDYIETGSYSGTVQEIGLRVTKISVWTGEIHVIPNGSIQEVTNHSRQHSIAVVDVGIAYEESITKAEQSLEMVLQEMYEQEENMIATPLVMGVQDLGDSDVVIRVSAECKTMTHWATARKMRKAIKDRFDELNIEIPYPRLVTYRREEQ